MTSNFPQIIIIVVGLEAVVWQSISFIHIPEVNLLADFITLFEMTTPLKEVIQGSATLLRIAEKPLGIGLAIGLVAGGANALILGIPMWISLTGGAVLGLGVCMIACPGMKSELKARREAEMRRKMLLRSKARTASAFTAFE